MSSLWLLASEREFQSSQVWILMETEMFVCPAVVIGNNIFLYSTYELKFAVFLDLILLKSVLFPRSNMYLSTEWEGWVCVGSVCHDL